jgi:hypothetical protein
MSDQNRMIIRFVARTKPTEKIMKNTKDGIPIGFRMIWTEVTMSGDGKWIFFLNKHLI